MGHRVKTRIDSPLTLTIPRHGSFPSMAIPEEGSIAPDFSVLDDAGQQVRLSDFKGRKVVLYFYPKDDTPG